MEAHFADLKHWVQMEVRIICRGGTLLKKCLKCSNRIFDMLICVHQNIFITWKRLGGGVNFIGVVPTVELHSTRRHSSDSAVLSLTKKLERSTRALPFNFAR